MVSWPSKNWACFLNGGLILTSLEEVLHPSIDFLIYLG